MISGSDARRLIDLFPPRVVVDGTTTPFLRNRSGEGFFVSDAIRDRLSSIVETENGQIPISALAERLHIANDEVAPFIRQHVKPGMLSKDGQHVITRSERDRIHTDLLQRKNQTVEQLLHSTNKPYMHLSQFARDFGTLYPEVSEPTSLILGELGDRAVPFPSGHIVSREWLDDSVDRASKDVTMKGFVWPLPPDVLLPKPLAPELCSWLAPRIVESARQNDTLSNSDVLHGYIMRVGWYESTCKKVKEAARAEARKQWEVDLTESSFDLRQTLSDIISSGERNISTDAHLIKTMINSDFATEVDHEFHQQLAELEKESNSEFASLWQDKVFARIQLYRQGIQALDDEKLREQLSDALREHICKDVVPKALVLAESRKLIRGETLKRNVSKLEQALASAGSLNSVVLALEKWTKRQSIESSDTEYLRARKRQDVDDLIKSMHVQKQSRAAKDGPRLFGILVVVLVAQRKDGLLKFASSAFAPKLLKQLKRSLDTGAYDKLEILKGKVKSGEVTEQDLESMRVMAAGA
ncbi:hypothetical protein LTR04_000416 [Oleoguttula sp. CCFEE 6159]|nr:hypothetical protein LTR04_000416 [Oleoguttula sp. CCFEE 6159]